MSDQVVVINGSARSDGNTQKAVATLSPFASFELVQLRNLKINHYSYGQQLSENDDFMLVVEKMLECTDIIFATPVYWYAMSGHMKVLFDRLTELITSKKDLGRKLKGKRCYLIACGTDDVLPEGFTVPFKRTCEYFDMEFVSTAYLQTKD